MTQLRQGFVGQVTPLTYTMGDMRILFQTAKDESLRNLLRHLEAHGFPPRLPHQPGTHALWSKPAVDHWMQNWGKIADDATPPTGRTITVETARAEAEARYQ